MENIGDKDAAIAERVRALLAAANSTAAPAVAAVPPRVVAVPASVTTPVGARRLDTSADPATVVANLTVAGIRYAVSCLNHVYCIIIPLDPISSVDPYCFIRIVVIRILSNLIVLSRGSSSTSML